MKSHRTVKDIPEYLEPQEVYERYIEGAQAIDYMRSTKRLEIRDLALVAFLYMTGLRISEALSVTREMIRFDLESGFMVVKGVRILKHRKTLVIKDKAVGLDGVMEPFVNVFRQHYDRVKRKHGLFEINRTRAFRVVRALTTEWPHYFRSQHISYLVNFLNLPTLVVADLMGISNLQTLEGYYHSSWIRHKEALSR